MDDEIQLTLIELCHACGTPEEEIMVWVVEGMIEPRGEAREEWRFDTRSLRRARTAARLKRDLELNAAGVALALDLLDEIDALKARIRRMGG